MNRGRWVSAGIAASVSVFFFALVQTMTAEDAAPAPAVAAPAAPAPAAPAAVAAAPVEAVPAAPAPGPDVGVPAPAAPAAVAPAPAAAAPAVAAPAAPAPVAAAPAETAPAAAVSATPAPARVAKPGTVTANVLNLRARPGVNYEVIAKFSQGDKVDIFGENEDWLEVRVPPQAEAFVAARYLDQDSKIIADRLKVHSGPGIVFSTYGFVTKGETVKKLGEPTADGWQKLEAPATLTAWVSKKFVAYEGTAPTVSATATATATLTVTPEVKPAAVTEPAQTETATAAVADVTPKVEAPAPAVPAATVAAPAVAALVPPEKTDAAAAAPVPAATVTPAVPEVTPVSIPAPTAATPVATVPELAMPPEIKPESGTAVTKDGIISSLKEQSSSIATHLLSMQMNETLYPSFFLISAKADINLSEWEGKNVRIYGKLIWYPGWKRAVVTVTGVQELTR